MTEYGSAMPRLSITASLAGIDTGCRRYGRCAQRGRGRFGWASGAVVVSDAGQLFTLPSLTWPEADVPAILGMAQTSLDLGERLILYADGHEVIFRAEQVGPLMDGLRSFVHHQETCQNRSCP